MVGQFSYASYKMDKIVEITPSQNANIFISLKIPCENNHACSILMSSWSSIKSSSPSWDIILLVMNMRCKWFTRKYKWLIYMCAEKLKNTWHSITVKQVFLSTFVDFLSILNSTTVSVILFMVYFFRLFRTQTFSAKLCNLRKIYMYSNFRKTVNITSQEKVGNYKTANI